MPLQRFINAYPFLACLFTTTPDRNQRHVPLEPIFTNSHYRSLLRDSEGATIPWIKALGTPLEASRFAEWLTSDSAPLLAVQLALYPNTRVVSLDLCRTPIDGLWAITATPSSSTLDVRALVPSRQIYPAHPESAEPSNQEDEVLRHPAVYQPVTREELEEFITSFDWSTTPMGTPENWPQSLKTLWSIMWRHEGPAAILWGKEHVLMYNAHYASTILAKKHPNVFGKKCIEAWGEIWETYAPLATKVMTEGTTFYKNEERFFFDRLPSLDGLLAEEVYYTWSWVPAKGEDDETVAIMNVYFDTTDKTLGERRMQCLQRVSERGALTHTRIEWMRAIISVLEETTYEAPFAAIYAYSPEPTAAEYLPVTTQETSVRYLSLVGAIGVPEGNETALHPLLHPYFPVKSRNGDLWSSSPHGGDSVVSATLQDNREPGSMEQEFSTSTNGAGAASFDWTPYLAWAHRSQEPILVSDLPPSVMGNIGRDRCWNDMVRQALVIPITVGSSASNERVENEENMASAVLILGVNTRVPYSSDGSYHHWAGIMRLALSTSLTAVIGREREAQHLEKMAQLDAAKTSFITNASHELRTPLTLIAGPITDALDQTSDHKVKSQLQLASRAVSRLNRLVDSLMDFTKIVAGQLQGNFQPYRLGQLVADLASMFRSIIESRSIEYIVDCDLTDERLTLIDPDAMERIVSNLVGNALKFTSSLLASGSITVRVVYGRDTVTLSVADTGMGIPSDALEKIVERFHQTQAPFQSYEGNGMGLALSAELVKLHGGRITVESTQASTVHGSTFSVEFPSNSHESFINANDDTMSSTIYQSYRKGSGFESLADQSTKLPTKWLGVIHEAAKWTLNITPSPTATTTTSSEDDSNPTSVSVGFASIYSFEPSDLILLVGDHPDMRAYMTSIFAPFCRVATATHGNQALELMKSYRPNLIISDVFMPVLNGFELCAAIRADPELRYIPFILLTAQSDEKNQLRQLSSGADDYLAKPFSSRELLARAHLQLQIGKERIHLQNQFDASLRELRVLTDLAPGQIIRGDSLRNIVWANPSWHQLTGVPYGASLNDWAAYVHSDGLADAMDSWNRVYDNEQSQVFECQFANGKTIHVNLTTFRDLDGLFCAMGTLTDITEIRQLQATKIALIEEREAIAYRKAEEAEQRRLSAEERHRAQELLIDVTSHELRQPISACLNLTLHVRNNMDLLHKQLITSVTNRTPFDVSPDILESIHEDLEALDSMYESCLSQERIANDVLSLSRMQIEVLSIDPTSFDLVEEIRRTCALFNTELQIRKITFTLHIGESIERLGPHHWVHLDRARLSQVITNLLSNAIKFTSLKKESRRIDITLEVSETSPADTSCEAPPIRNSSYPIAVSAPLFIYISVHDSGPGLKPEDLALLFQRFSQGSNSHAVFGGSGLGLFISRKLCDLMGGRIEVVSEDGHGATFRFFVRASMAAVPVDQEALRVPNAVLQAQFATQESLRVLLTEDNEINQRVLSRQLRKAGCEVRVASNGLAALEAIKETHASVDGWFQVILMDCEMPVMDGYTAVRELRSLEANEEVGRRHYVIAITGNARLEQVQKALDAGMDKVVIKPYKINDLLELMRKGTSDAP